MPSSLVIPTEKPDIVLRELTMPRDDSDLFNLIDNNRLYWRDISGLYSDVQDVTNERLAKAQEHELRLGVQYQTRLVGFLCLVSYGEGDPWGNWLGYWIDQRHARQGLATAAGRATVGYVSANPDLNRTITTATAPENIASQTVLRKLGFEEEPDPSISEYYPGDIVFRLHL